MTKFTEFLKKNRFTKSSNILSIIIGVIIIIYVIYGFLGSIGDLRSLPGSLPFQVVWLGLGVILISNGLHGLKKRDTINIIEDTALEIPYRKLFISIISVAFIICLVRFIIIFSGNNWDVGFLLGIWLFGFQLPLTLVAIFTKNKSTLHTVSVLSVLFGIGTFLI